jgi:hypothetical protein
MRSVSHQGKWAISFPRTSSYIEHIILPTVNRSSPSSAESEEEVEFHLHKKTKAHSAQPLPLLLSISWSIQSFPNELS